MNKIYIKNIDNLYYIISILINIYMLYIYIYMYLIIKNFLYIKNPIQKY
jgi:hypothetical protein